MHSSSILPIQTTRTAATAAITSWRGLIIGIVIMMMMMTPTILWACPNVVHHGRKTSGRRLLAVLVVGYFLFFFFGDPSLSTQLRRRRPLGCY